MHTLDVAKLAALEARIARLPLHLRTILLDGAVLSFDHAANPARFINTGNLLRELLRELFKAISPDENITQCRWYTPHPKSGVTRRHRTLFAVYSYLDPSYFPEDFVADVEGLADAVIGQVRVLSSFAHPTAETVATAEAAAVAAFNNALELFLELFDAIDAGRAHVLEALKADLEQHLPELFTNEFFDDLDMLSTHTRPQDADGIEVGIVQITEEAIKFVGAGRVYCDLQYGSDGDCRRGDGVEWKDSFPFTFSGEAPIDEPRRVSVEPADVSVDTSSYFDATAYE
jgi:hypothetical protein